MCTKCIFCGVHHHHNTPDETLKRELTTIKPISKSTDGESIEDVHYRLDGKINVYISSQYENVQHYINIEYDSNKIVLPLEYIESLQTVFSEIRNCGTD